MKRFLIEVLCIAWPPYRRKVDENRGWWMVNSAFLHLLHSPDWTHGDYEAGKILNQKLRELNRS